MSENIPKNRNYGVLFVACVTTQQATVILTKRKVSLIFCLKNIKSHNAVFHRKTTSTNRTIRNPSTNTSTNTQTEKTKILENQTQQKTPKQRINLEILVSEGIETISLETQTKPYFFDLCTNTCGLLKKIVMDTGATLNCIHPSFLKKLMLDL